MFYSVEYILSIYPPSDKYLSSKLIYGRLTLIIATGHVEKFTDLMVKDSITGESLRADKLLEDIIDDLLENNPTMPKVKRHTS